MFAGYSLRSNGSAELSSGRVAFGGLEKTNQLGQAALVGFACGALAIRFDPVGVLNAQVFVNLLLKFRVRMNLFRHGNFLSEGSSEIAFRFHPQDRLLSRCRYCA